MQYYVAEAAQVEVSLTDMSGKIVYQTTITTTEPGLQYANLRAEVLAAGPYILSLTTLGETYRKRIVRVE